MKTIKINNKKFLENVKKLIDSLCGYTPDNNDIDDLYEICFTKKITVKNTAFLYMIIYSYIDKLGHEEIIEAFLYIKKILEKHFKYEVKSKNGTTYLAVSEI
ncbi:hypothetical protein [Sulfurimonas sp. CS5]|uniref:hypothetical protein n=1 Tax=Sulfurimonas sp. CS5 TaxID=3391145 RepID=UPI0039E95806